MTGHELGMILVRLDQYQVILLKLFSKHYFKNKPSWSIESQSELGWQAYHRPLMKS